MKYLTISVVIATYNRSASLLETLGALEKQTFPSADFEVIVVNDGSSDNTEEVLAAFKSQTSLHFSHFYQKNKGPAAARNLGINEAKGSIIAFTDDDCLPSVNWLSHIKLAFEFKPIVGLQGSTYTDRDKITPLTHQIDNLNGNKSVPTCNAAYDRHVLLELGGFDEAFPFPHNEDADLAWRIQEKGAIGFSYEAVVYHPPRVDKFEKVARRMKILESEFRLFHKNPESYRLNRTSSPWRNIYWEVGVKIQCYYFKSRFKYWKRPTLVIQGLLLTLIWWWDLVRLYPRFVKIDRENRNLFQKAS